MGKTLPVPKVDTAKMPEVKELEARNLHNQQWTFTSDKSGLENIFKGESPFGDGTLEAFEGSPEGFEIPKFPDRQEEFAFGLDKDLLSKVMAIPSNGNSQKKVERQKVRPK